MVKELKNKQSIDRQQTNVRVCMAYSVQHNGQRYAKPSHRGAAKRELRSTEAARNPRSTHPEAPCYVMECRNAHVPQHERDNTDRWGKLYMYCILGAPFFELEALRV